MTITSQNSRFEMNVPFSELEHWLTDYFLVITSVIFVQPRYSVLTCNLPIERLLLDVSFAHVSRRLARFLSRSQAVAATYRISMLGWFELTVA